MTTTSSPLVATVLALGVALAAAAPRQNYYYYQPPYYPQQQQQQQYYSQQQQQQQYYPQQYYQPQQHQQQQQNFYGGNSPFPFGYQGGFMTPSSYNNPGFGYGPAAQPGYNHGFGTSTVQSYGPVPPQYYSPPQQPQQPQYVFVYPNGGGNNYGPSFGAAPAAPRPPPMDETGDAEVLINSLSSIEDQSNERREPLSPGVALSGPEAGQRGVPLKQTVLGRPQRVQKVVKAPKVVVEQEAEDKIDDDVDSVVIETDEDEEDDMSLGNRYDDHGWKRRLAPGLQSVYLEAHDDANSRLKAPAGSESVVVGGDDTIHGPSVASVKPAAIALAGPGGVASAAPVGTAVVGPGGLAVAAPSATAVAGPTNGVPPGALGGAASARSNFRLHQMLEKMYAAPARRAALRSASSYNLEDFY